MFAPFVGWHAMQQPLAGEAVGDRPLRGCAGGAAGGPAFRDRCLRIRRAVEQRTNMLSGVSHDFTTPSRGLKLQFHSMEEGPDKEDMEADVAEMEAMLDGYLTMPGQYRRRRSPFNHF